MHFVRRTNSIKCHKLYMSPPQLHNHRDKFTIVQMKHRDNLVPFEYAKNILRRVHFSYTSTYSRHVFTYIESRKTRLSFTSAIYSCFLNENALILAFFQTTFSSRAFSLSFFHKTSYVFFLVLTALLTMVQQKNTRGSVSGQLLPNFYVFLH